MEQVIDLPTGEVGMTIRGDGPPVVVFPRDVIPPTPNPFLERLEEQHTVYVVDLPGFGRSPRPPWLRTVTQLATLGGHAIEHLGLPPCALVGMGFGGWVAADLATQAPGRFEALVLASPWGVKPTSGEIADFVLFDLAEWAARGFHDPDRYTASCGDDVEFDVLRSWDNARESVMAVAWKPIGHSRPLAQMLSLLRTPTLIAWGAEDQIVPATCASDWASALPNCETVVFPEAGHQVDVEAPERLAEAAMKFIRNNEETR